MCAKSLQSCLTVCNPMDCRLPDPFVHGILQARMLEWVAMTSSRGSSQPRDRTHISCGSCSTGGFFITEPPGKSIRKVTRGQMLRLSRSKLSPWLPGMANPEQPRYLSLNLAHSTMHHLQEVSEHRSQRVRDLFLSLPSQTCLGSPASLTAPVANMHSAVGICGAQTLSGTYLSAVPA